jgi:hypothetical protein
MPVMYGCETWCLKIKEALRLKVFENWALKNILGPKREDVSGDWRKLHESFHDLYFPPNITCIRVMR